MNITLKTLPEASEQEVFDHVAKHLLTQMQSSVSANGGCRYRNDSGLKCAAGCLIADDEYTEDMDYPYSPEWQTLVELKQVPSNHWELISKLQGVHDDYDPLEWRDELHSIAIERELEFNH